MDQLYRSCPRSVRSPRLAPWVVRRRDLFGNKIAAEECINSFRSPDYSATIWMRTASGDQGVKWRPVAAL
jgi:hypothetical protein